MFYQLSSPTYLLLTISSSLLSSLNTLNININLILNELKISQKLSSVSSLTNLLLKLDNVNFFAKLKSRLNNHIFFTRVI